jgi:hypothetical protein
MNDRRQEGSGRIPSPQLKAWLRELGGIGVPRGLKEKLMVAIPAVSARRIRRSVIPCRPRALRYVAVAAAVVVVVSIVVQFLTPLPRSPRLVADINDRSGTAALVDYNSSQPRDMNISDNNMIP